MRQEVIDHVVGQMPHFKLPCAIGCFRSFYAAQEQLTAEEAMNVCHAFSGAFVRPKGVEWEFIQVGWRSVVRRKA